METPNFWWEVYFCLSPGKRKKSKGTRSGTQGECSRT